MAKQIIILHMIFACVVAVSLSIYTKGGEMRHATWYSHFKKSPPSETNRVVISWGWSLVHAYYSKQIRSNLIPYRVESHRWLWDYYGGITNTATPGWSIQQHTLVLQWRGFVFLAVLFGAYPSLVLARMINTRYTRKRLGLCLSCGYDLRGSPSGICPECARPSKNATGQEESQNS